MTLSGPMYYTLSLTVFKCTTCQQSKPHQRNRFFSRVMTPTLFLVRPGLHRQMLDFSLSVIVIVMHQIIPAIEDMSCVTDQVSDEITCLNLFSALFLPALCAQIPSSYGYSPPGSHDVPLHCSGLNPKIFSCRLEFVCDWTPSPQMSVGGTCLGAHASAIIQVS